jgi:hypothetical protein
VKTLQDHFCLNRENFQINPKQSIQDALLFFGKDRNKTLIERIVRGYRAGYVPRIYLFGNYGTGKTHLLYHLKHHFDTSPDEGVIAIVVQVEAESRTRFQSLHKRLLDGIGTDRLEKAYQDYALAVGLEHRETKFGELFSDPNLYKVIQLIQTGPAMKNLAWRWLTGERLSAAEQSQLGVTRSLLETGELVDVLVAIGELFKRTDHRLLFLIDEGEALHNVSNADSQSSWHDAFRRLADTNDNQSVGWILAIYTTLNSDAPRFVIEADIMTRLARAGQIQLDPLGTVEVRQFLTDLLNAFVDKDCASQRLTAAKAPSAKLYPFADAALEAFVGHAAQAPESAIPRVILKALTACALEALEADAVVIDVATVDRVAPAEFAEVQ